MYGTYASYKKVMIHKNIFEVLRTTAQHSFHPPENSPSVIVLDRVHKVPSFLNN